jgi:branched-chain amino acid transport system ATP-binding protein
VSLEVRGVTTAYGDIKVVRDVSVAVRAGEVTAVLGRNGAGKTSLLRAISGLNRCLEGSVHIDGKRVDQLPPYKRQKQGLSYVQDGKRIFRLRTVEENLLIGGYAQRLSRRKGQDLLEAAYQRFPILADRRAQRAGALSGGQQQMLAIAQALVIQPRYLLLDEPSAGLAPAIVADVLRTVEQLRDEGLGILLVEQSVDFALKVAAEVLVLDLGRTGLAGRAGEADLRTRIEHAYFGSLDAEAARAP